MDAPKHTLLSKKGMKELMKTIAQLEEERADIIKQLREADNVQTREERLERSEKLAHIDNLETEIAEKQHILRAAKLLPSKRKRLKAALGSVVDLVDQSGRLISYTIVDSIEANPSDGRISAESPLGSQLLGKATQDIVEWGRGTHRHKMQIAAIK